MMKLVHTCAMDGAPEMYRERINELLDVPEDEWSPREKEFMDKAFSHGELYQMEVIKTPTALALTTDLGSPDSKIELLVPHYIDEKKVMRALQTLAETLSNGD